MATTVIEQLIEQQGWSVEYVAVKLKLSAMGVRRLLAQRDESPRIIYVTLLCDALDVEMAEIIGDDGCWRRLADKTGAVEKEAQP